MGDDTSLWSEKPRRRNQGLGGRSESDIKYAVMLAFRQELTARQIAVGAIVSGANPILG